MGLLTENINLCWLYYPYEESSLDKREAPISFLLLWHKSQVQIPNMRSLHSGPKIIEGKFWLNPMQRCLCQLSCRFATCTVNKVLPCSVLWQHGVFSFFFPFFFFIFLEHVIIFLICLVSFFLITLLPIAANVVTGVISAKDKIRIMLNFVFLSGYYWNAIIYIKIKVQN